MPTKKMLTPHFLGQLLQGEDSAVDGSIRLPTGPPLLKQTAVLEALFPQGLPRWMVQNTWLLDNPWDLYRGRGIELCVSPLDTGDRDDFDTPRFSISWGVAYAATPEEEREQLVSEENIGCLGTLNTESWPEALICISSHCAS